MVAIADSNIGSWVIRSQSTATCAPITTSTWCNMVRKMRRRSRGCVGGGKIDRGGKGGGGGRGEGKGGGGREGGGGGGGGGGEREGGGCIKW